MTTIQCNNSTAKAVSFFLNGGYTFDEKALEDLVIE